MLEISLRKAFGVTLGTGLEVFGDGIYAKLRLTLQGIEICDRFFALELGSLDIILGVQWLEKLGTVTVKWKNQIMRFLWEGQPVTLMGDASLQCSKIPLKTMVKTLRAEKHGILIECNGLIKSETASKQPTQIPDFLTPILAKYPK